MDDSTAYIFAHCDVSSSVYNAVCQVLKRRGWHQTTNSADAVTGANLILGDRKHLPFKKMGVCRGDQQLINYYRGSSAICRKTALARLLKDKFGCDVSTPAWCLPSFVLYPQGLLENCDLSLVQRHKLEAQLKRDERAAFVAAHQAHTAGHSKARAAVWIAKAASGAKGEGVKISADPDQLISYIDTKTTAHVVQKYVEEPFLLEGQRKFDIRLWVLLDHDYRIFVYKDGVLRTSSEVYEAHEYDNLTSHITNHSLQEAKSANYGKYEPGNEMFFSEFDRYLQNNHELSMDRDILPQMYSIIKELLGMIKEELTTDQLDYHSFQLFGFDFLLDSRGQVSLLEVNGSPACAQKLLPQLSESLVITAIDTVFKPQEQQPPTDTLFIRI